MYRILIIFSITFVVKYTFGQEENTMPLYPYKYSLEIAQGLSSGEMRVHKAAQNYSYIGKYHLALNTPNEVDLEWGFDTLTDVDKAYFKQFKAHDAVDAILDQAEKERIIILNEAHHKPVHRVFVQKLLKGLYKRGYRHLGLEALTNFNQIDSSINARGYPINSPFSGEYINEPQMANLIRQALDEGFQVFAYEKFGTNRDSSQARMIQEVIEQNPDDKVLVLCGWYHLLEQENRTRTWMAKYLKEFTGIDPFTIYQDILIEKYCRQESPFMQMMEYDQPTVFKDKSGKFYNGHKENLRFDALLYHPRTRYIFNRPDWLVHHQNNQLVSVTDIGINYPCLIKAYHAKEPDESVPVDIIERSFEDDLTALVLPPGKYRVVIENQKGEKEVKEIVVANR
ncbi:MAG: hypothetical protein AAFO07_01295 [Bacteroidota bacterium]